jgi:hypothetical protein
MNLNFFPLGSKHIYGEDESPDEGMVSIYLHHGLLRFEIFFPNTFKVFFSNR